MDWLKTVHDAYPDISALRAGLIIGLIAFTVVGILGGVGWYLLGKTQQVAQAVTPPPAPAPDTKKNETTASGDGNKNSADNQSKTNKDDGLFVFRGATFSGAKEGGIVVHNGANISLRDGSKVDNNGGPGIDTNGSVDVSSSSVSGNKGPGILQRLDPQKDKTDSKH